MNAMMMSERVRTLIAATCLVLLSAGIAGAQPLPSSPDWAWMVQIVDDSADVGEFNSLALDPTTGDPRISYYDATNGDLKYAQWSGTGWEVELVDEVGDVGDYTSLALDPITGYPRISYYDVTSNTLEYAAWDGTAWGRETVDDSPHGAGMYSSLAICPLDGYPHISYQHCTGSSCCLWYARWDGAMWLLDQVDCSWGDTGRRTSLALDPVSCDPRISYQRWETDGDLMYAEWVSPTWSIDEVAYTGNHGHYSSLALDPDTNEPRIAAAYPNVQTTYYFVRDEGQWHAHSYLPNSIGHCSLDLDTTSGVTRGFPRISHTSHNPLYNLMYAAWNGTGWEQDSVYTEGYSKYSSIKLDPTTGAPRISFYDETNERLMYARPVKVFVGNIRMAYRVYGEAVYGVFARVPILDEQLGPAEGATVTAEWTLPQGQTRLQTKATGANGAAVFGTISRQEGVYSIAVLDVMAPGYEYDPDMNWETGEELMVP